MTKSNNLGPNGFDAHTEKGIREYTFPLGYDVNITRDGLRMDVMTDFVETANSEQHADFLRHLQYAVDCFSGFNPFVSTYRGFPSTAEPLPEERDLKEAIKRTGVKIIPGYVGLLGNELSSSNPRLKDRTAMIIARADYPMSMDLVLEGFFATMYKTIRSEGITPNPMAEVNFDAFLDDIFRETGKDFSITRTLSSAYFKIR